jgi:dihydropteroate synthase
LNNKILNLGGIKFDLSVPRIMGVLNFDINSFYQKSYVSASDDLIKRIERMLEDGADLIDLGATSSRPGASVSDPDQDLKRLLPALRMIRKKYPKLIISVDTYHSKVAHVCIGEGINLINDISAGQIDSKIFDEVINGDVGYVLMHMRGLPFNMQNNIKYNDLFEELTDFFKLKLNELKTRGLKNIIIDPGLGFGKSLESNYQIIKKMNYFNTFDCPLLIGVSRKSLIQNLLGVNPDDALNGTTALHMLCLNNGANVLRVHDVKAAKEAIKIWGYYVSV